MRIDKIRVDPFCRCSGASIDVGGDASGDATVGRREVEARAFNSRLFAASTRLGLSRLRSNAVHMRNTRHDADRRDKRRLVSHCRLRTPPRIDLNDGESNDDCATRRRRCRLTRTAADCEA